MRVTIREIDELGTLQAEADLLNKRISAIKDKIKKSDLSELKGNIYTASVSRSVRTTLDTAKAKLILGDRVKECQKESEVVSIRIKSKLAA